ncbi:MAG TPA: ABC transporter ATP-binding protein [Flavobacterium sp.]|uniref:ABC transporter ATP-binding protein n=1 Tax=Flavobacterium sp. TaxID=239 RepID=UPI002ED5535B
MTKNIKKYSSPVISLKNITKKYVIHHQKPTFSGQLLHREKNESFLALNSISIDIYKGERIGIIGKNGCGKTTLLKIITGITKSSSGTIFTNGKIVSLINLSAGFHPDLTGEENVYLNAMLLGNSKDQTRKKFEEIVHFADVHQFIDAPFYTYSEGMKLRLGFAVAVHSDPDILILDESSILAGDHFFQTKIIKKIHSFFRLGKTVIIVTHWLDFLRAHCNRIIWMEAGKIKEIDGVKLLAKYSS